MLFRLPMGDWSSDGHGKCEWYIVETNKTLQECFDAWFLAKGKFPEEVHPDNICNQYEERTFLKEVRDKIASLGFTGFDKLDNAYNDNNSLCMEIEKLVEYQLWFMKQGDP